MIGTEASSGSAKRKLKMKLFGWKGEVFPVS